MKDGTNKKHGGARPGSGYTFAPSDQDRHLVLALRGAGFSHESIASQLGPKGIDDKTLVRHFAHELRIGTDRINGICVTGLVKAMQNGEAWALCFWAKTRMGWRETTDHRFVDERGRDRPFLLSDADRLVAEADSEVNAIAKTDGRG